MKSMKSFIISLICISFLSVFPHNAWAKHYVDSHNVHYQFISPYPGSLYNNINTIIAIRQGNLITADAISADPDLIEISCNGVTYEYSI
ncbi:MAG: hypothetical protein RL220_257, partial [Bacteroidota bacterium]